MAERNDNEERRERPSRNLEGLLNFCTEVTAREDTTSSSSVNELTQERREFLENVLASFQGDVAKCMASLVEQLLEPSVLDINADVSEQEEALEQLAEYVEDINYAIDLFKMNAFPIIVKVLDCPHFSLQRGAAQVIADVCQNNELCQQNMLPLNTMQKLLNIVDSHSDPDCKVKALYALSCLIREFEPAEKLFSDLSGFCYLMRAIQTKIPKLIIKAIFLLNYFIGKVDHYQDTLLDMGFVDQLISVMFSEGIDDTSREYCTLSLLKLSSSYDKALHECLRPEFNLVFQLRERQKAIKGKEEFQEEYQYIKSLLELLEESDDKEEVGIR